MTEKKFFALLILGFLALVWGSSFILIKKGLVAFDPYQVATLRILITSICFTPIVILRWKEIDWTRFWIFLAIGLSGTGIPSFLFPLAQTEISSSLSGVLNSLTPMFAFVFSIFIFRQSYKNSSLWGLILGFIGVMMLFLVGNDLTNSGNIWYALFAILGTIFYAFNVNAVKAFFQDTPPVLISAVSFSLLGPVALILFFTTGIIEDFNQHPSGLMSLGSITLLAIFSTVIATVIFFRLVQQTNAVFAASVSYVVPIVAVGWGILDGESFLLIHTVAVALILIGVYLIRK